MKSRAIAPKVLIAVMMWPLVSDAAYLRYDITGVVTEVRLLPGLTSVVVGDTWRATVFVEETAPDAFPGAPAVGRYASTRATMTIGEALVVPEFSPYVEVTNDDPADFVFIEGRADGSVCIDGFCVGNIGLDYTDFTRTALRDDSLAGTIGLSIDEFENLADGDPVPRNSFIAKFRESSGGRIGGTPTGLEVTRVAAIPLPPTLWLAATGLGVLAVRRVWRRRPGEGRSG